MGNIFGTDESSEFKRISYDDDYTRNTNTCYNIERQVYAIAKGVDKRGIGTYIDVAKKIKEECNKLGLIIILVDRRNLGPLANLSNVHHVIGFSNTRLQTNIYVKNDYVFVME